MSDVDVSGMAVTGPDGDTTTPTGAPTTIPAGTGTGSAGRLNPPPAEPAPTNGTPDQSAQIADLTARLARIEETRANRPASTIDQLQTQIDELRGVKQDAVDAKTGARAVADSAESQVLELRNELRTMRLQEAASKHGVPTDRVPFVASAVASMEGDPDLIVGELVKAQPWLAAKSAPATPDVSGNRSTTTGDPGIDGLAKDIAERNR